MQSLSEWLKGIRVTQTEIAEMTKIPLVTLNNYVRGTRKLPICVAEKIAKATNAKIEIFNGNIVFSPRDRRRKLVRS
jgi:transcriptional regulator with XRE-family HTH domain